MDTQCSPEQLEFHALGRRQVSARFDGGLISTDGGGLLLREADLRIGLSARLGGCFTDYRNPLSVEHSVHTLVAQHLYGVALGYEDLNDHDVLRADSVLAMLVGKVDLLGEQRVRERDRGNPLASSSTLNRLELSCPDSAAQSRYKRIAADTDAFDELLVELFVESHRKAPREIWLDLDATDDPLHGQQQGRFFHGYYGCYCYLPLYIFAGEHLLCARLRRSNIDGCAGSVEELERIVTQLRQHWPKTRINIRADSGFCRDGLMNWCEDNDIGYVLGVAKNARLTRALGEAMAGAQQAHQRTGKAARRFRDFCYRTRKSWTRSRRVVGKAEYLAKGPNPRFVVTNLPARRVSAKRLYEKLYCVRGEMENRIKEQQLGLFADRTSTATMRANQLRLYFASFAYVLMHAVRRIGAGGTQFARAQCTTLRLKLLKVGVRVKVSVRRVWLSYAQSYPYADTFIAVLANLQRQPLWKPSG